MPQQVQADFDEPIDVEMPAKDAEVPSAIPKGQQEVDERLTTPLTDLLERAGADQAVILTIQDAIAEGADTAVQSLRSLAEGEPAQTPGAQAKVGSAAGVPWTWALGAAGAGWLAGQSQNPGLGLVLVLGGVAVAANSRKAA